MRTSVNTLSLRELCDPLGREWGGSPSSVELSGPDVQVCGLASDSRQVAPGDLFLATPGTADDGLRFVDQALTRGAVGVVAERRPALPDEVPFVGVPDGARAKAVLANHFYGYPSRRLDVVGITGTNGKTTTAHMLRSMLTMDGRRTGIVGTLGASFDGTEQPLSNTTPDAIELQRLLARMVDANLSSVVMEVSSHALAQQRVHGIDFRAAVFTNLSRDHLDYHGTMDDYAATKGRLFAELPAGRAAVLNGADPMTARYAAQTPGRVVRYALETNADIRGDVTRLDPDGTSFRVRGDGLELALSMRMVGRHNVANALAAVATAVQLEVPPAAIRMGLSSLTAVPGRLEPVECGQDFRVFVDYAHTPDALQKVLDLLRPLTRGRLLVVFGCGGDRDRSKRPLMGHAVAAAADELFVTSDNPRSEDPQAILDEVLTGIDAEAVGRTHALVDRRLAIESACRAARGGDIVLIAGKGHETTQTIGDRRLPFDDREVAREVLWNL